VTGRSVAGRNLTGNFRQPEVITTDVLYLQAMTQQTILRIM